MFSIQKRAQVKMKGKYYKSHHKKWQRDNVKKPRQMVFETVAAAILETSALQTQVFTESRV